MPKHEPLTDDIGAVTTRYDDIPDPGYEDRNYPHLSEEIRGFLRLNRANTIRFREEQARRRAEERLPRAARRARAEGKGNTAQSG